MFAKTAQLSDQDLYDTLMNVLRAPIWALKNLTKQLTPNSLQLTLIEFFQFQLVSFPLGQSTGAVGQTEPTTTCDDHGAM